MHVPEESDSGAVPMNHSNKDEKLLAESEEGRPLIKENILQPSTHSTQSEAEVERLKWILAMARTNNVLFLLDEMLVEQNRPTVYLEPKR